MMMMMMIIPSSIRIAPNFAAEWPGSENENYF
jgi:hypothetical protein